MPHVRAIIKCRQFSSFIEPPHTPPCSRSATPYPLIWPSTPRLSIFSRDMRRLPACRPILRELVFIFVNARAASRRASTTIILLRGRQRRATRTTKSSFCFVYFAVMDDIIVHYAVRHISPIAPFRPMAAKRRREEFSATKQRIRPYIDRVVMIGSKSTQQNEYFADRAGAGKVIFSSPRHASGHIYSSGNASAVGLARAILMLQRAS